MNSRFEPDGEKASSWFKNLIPFDFSFFKGPPKDEDKLIDYIEEKMKESNFSKSQGNEDLINSYKVVNLNPEKPSYNLIVDVSPTKIKKSEPLDSESKKGNK